MSTGKTTNTFVKNLSDDVRELSEAFRELSHDVRELPEAFQELSDDVREVIHERVCCRSGRHSNNGMFWAWPTNAIPRPDLFTTHYINVTTH